jgi:hypothetical protein
MVAFHQAAVGFHHPRDGCGEWGWLSRRLHVGTRVAVCPFMRRILGTALLLHVLVRRSQQKEGHPTNPTRKAELKMAGASLVLRMIVLLSFAPILAGCMDKAPPRPLGECEFEEIGRQVCIGNDVYECGASGWGATWFHEQGCLPGMCTTYAVANGKTRLGCKAPNATCSGSSDLFCSDNMVVSCSSDGKPMVQDDCQPYTDRPPRYCVAPNDGSSVVCSYLPTPCPVDTKHVCINVGQGPSGFEGIVRCDTRGIATYLGEYYYSLYAIENESCTIRSCSVEGQKGCIGNPTGANKWATCVDGLWEIGLSTCSCSTDCI